MHCQKNILVAIATHKSLILGMRSMQSENESVFHFGEPKIDLARRLVTARGEVVTLTPTEYDALHTLV